MNKENDINMTIETIREMTEQDKERIRASARRFIKKYGTPADQEALDSGTEVQEVIDSVLHGYNGVQRRELYRKWVYMQSRSFDVKYNRHLSFQDGKIVLVIPVEE